MRIEVLLISAAVLFFTACSNDRKVEPAVGPPTATAPTADLSPALPPGYIEMNDITRNLIDGFWHIQQVFERVPTSRYQAQKGRYYKFAENGDYALFNPDGKVFHLGKWRYKPGDGDRNYISIDAKDTQYNNQWKVIMSKDDAVFVGTQTFNNPGVQQRLEKITSLPASAIQAQKE
jgi:hypothetical protein